jgi:hypothetical protein
VTAVSESREDQTTRNHLSWHWEGAYTITVSGGAWTATRTDDGSVLTAGAGWELREAIIADYAARPVRRREG